MRCINQPNHPFSGVPSGRKGGYRFALNEIARQRCGRFEGIHLVRVYQEPRPNIFNHASVIGVTPFAVGGKKAATLKVRSHDADTLAPTRQLVVDGVNPGQLGFTGQSLLRFHRA